MLNDAKIGRGTENRVFYFGKKFLGLPYVAHTLELGDTEHLIVNLHELDCTTFVETVVALSMCDQQDKRTFADYCRNLEKVRFRGGKMGDYTSRLHYFTWWAEDNEQLGIVMGQQLGLALSRSGEFDGVDILMPVPLHRRKERIRGYNQSLLLCKGMAMTLGRPISEGNLVRTRHTETQTRKSREERLDNMQGVFRLSRPDELEDKHVLLVDDVLTTGSTTEGCWEAMRNVKGLRISIATLAVSGDT